MTDPDDGSTRITGPASSTSETSAHTHDTRTTGTAAGADVTSHMTGTSTARSGREGAVGHYKTSAAAVFALVFGLAALFCALTGILAPAAILFGIIGIILGIVAYKIVKRPGVTGKGVATAGLVTAVLGLLLGGAILGGLAALVNNQSALDRISRYVDNARADLPSSSEVRNKVDDTVNK